MSEDGRRPSSNTQIPITRRIMSLQIEIGTKGATSRPSKAFSDAFDRPILKLIPFDRPSIYKFGTRKVIKTSF